MTATLATADPDLLQDSVREVFESTSADLRAAQRPLWKKFGYRGLAGLAIDAAAGGGGKGPPEVAVVMEEVGRHLAPSAFLFSGVVCATAIAGGSALQRLTHLPSIARGDLVAALALQEGDHWAPTQVAMPASASVGGFVLHGRKTWVHDALDAELLLVVARTRAQATGTDGLTVFMVDARAPGVHVQPARAQGAHRAATIAFDHVRVDAGAVLGAVDQGWAVLAPALRAGATAAAAQLLGVGEQALEMIHPKASTARQRLDGARAAVREAVRLLHARPAAADQAVREAKAKAGLAAVRCAQAAVRTYRESGGPETAQAQLALTRARLLDAVL